MALDFAFRTVGRNDATGRFGFPVAERQGYFETAPRQFSPLDRDATSPFKRRVLSHDHGDEWLL